MERTLIHRNLVIFSEHILTKLSGAIIQMFMTRTLRDFDNSGPQRDKQFLSIASNKSQLNQQPPCGRIKMADVVMYSGHVDTVVVAVIRDFKKITTSTATETSQKEGLTGRTMVCISIDLLLYIIRLYFVSFSSAIEE